MKELGRGRHGLGLPTTLGFTAAVVMVAFVCVAACFAQLTLSTRTLRLSESELTADAVSQLAGARLLSDPTFGTRGSAAEKSLELTLPQGTARLTFDADQALRWGIPVSLNNLASDQAIPGYQRNIPGLSVQLLAQGTSGGRVRLLEIVLSQPAFKWAVASTGAVHSTGGLQVIGIKDFSMLVRGIDHLPPEQILPGHVVSDSANAHALALDSNSTATSLVTGDAQSMGGVDLGPFTSVRGQVKAQAETAKLPELEVQIYDPAGVDGMREISQSSVATTLDVSGVWRRSGNLTVRQGGMALDQGYLYVDGDLEVYGGLSGKGAIFATGKVTVHGLSEFSADNLQAIVAKGDLSLDGSGPNSSAFSGLLMGGGRLHARQVTLVGSFIGTSREAHGSSVELDQVKLVSSPQAIHLDFPKLLMATQPPHHVQTMENGQVVTHSMQAVTDPYLDLNKFYDPVADRLDPELATAQNLKPQYIFPDGYWAKTDHQLFDHANFFTANVVSTVNVTMAQELLDSYKDSLRRADQLYQEARRRGLARGSFSLDPNSFIQSSDKMRRLYWRVVQ